jgi:hypothetical protein
MKPSELRGDVGPRDEWKLPYPRSELADPPITAEEARKADTAICRWHNGSITHSPTTQDTYGRAYFCPIGRCYWRYSKQDAGMYGALPYQDAGFV